LGDLPAERDEMELLWAMGWETANIHLGSGQGAAILKTLKQAPDGWLQKGAKKMTAAVMSDWKEWRKR
jgi:hypothetical protein